MKLSIPASEIKTAIQGLARVQQRGHLPVLNCVHFAVDAAECVSMTATNLTETLTYQVRDTACNDGPGMFLCPITDLKTIAKAAQRNSTVSFELTDDAVVVRTDVGGNEIVRAIATVSIDEWPAGSDLDITYQTCDVTGFVEAMRCALGFASKDSTRQVLNSVLLHAERKTVVATDGRRLTRLELPEIPFGDADLIVPRTKVLTSKTLEADTGTVGMHCSDDVSHLGIEAGPWSYLVRCLDGTYPNYEQVVPTHDNWLGTIEFADTDIVTLKSVMRQFPEASHDAIAIYADADVVAVVAGRDGAFTHVALAETRFDDERAVVRCVNRNFLMDALNAGFTGMEIPIEATTPVRFHGVRAGLHVLMPLRDIAAQPVIEYVETKVKTTIQKTQEEPLTTNTESKEPADATSATAPAHNPDLTVVEPEDPITALRTGIDEVAASIRAASDLLRNLKKQAREAERALQKREKQITTRERKVQTVTDQLAGLKDAVGF